MQHNNDYSRKMDGVSFDGATFNGVANFQGDNNTQSFQSGLDGQTEKLFTALIEEIKKLPDADEVNDNLEDLSKIKEAAVSKNKERMIKFFKRLSSVIQVSAAGVDLAKNLGILALL